MTAEQFLFDIADVTGYNILLFKDTLKVGNQHDHFTFMASPNKWLTISYSKEINNWCFTLYRDGKFYNAPGSSAAEASQALINQVCESVAI